MLILWYKYFLIMPTLFFDMNCWIEFQIFYKFKNYYYEI